MTTLEFTATDEDKAAARRGEVWKLSNKRVVDGEYSAFLDAKRTEHRPSGFVVDESSLNVMLFDWQKLIVSLALKRGKCAIFAECGLGKTPMQLDWARHVCLETNSRVLILAPLAVSSQTLREAGKFGIDKNLPIAISRDGTAQDGITITNYEQAHKFNAKEFSGIVLDESSILKSFDGKTRTHIIEQFATTDYKLCCTATPAPNDYMELGNHAEFLNIMSYTEMLSMFFVHDGARTSQWRLKGHAQQDFWDWVASWAISLRAPSDLGFADDGFKLPEMRIHKHFVDHNGPLDGFLFKMPAATLTEHRIARKQSIPERVQMAAAVRSTDSPTLVWCNLNDESQALKDTISGCVEVKGADSSEHKEKSMLDFSEAEDGMCLVTKPSICGFGMNWQNCHTQIFCGLSHSYEQFYQAVRRSWRFGQTKPVDIHIIVSDAEAETLRTIQRKQEEHEQMQEGMFRAMTTSLKKALGGTERKPAKYEEDVKQGAGWSVHLGDCVDVTKTINTDSMDYSVFSPPFASLYTYSDSERDMGNSKDYAEFEQHFRYLVGELFRVTKPGRLCSVHCMNLPMMKVRDGVIGMRDFRGDIIRWFLASGWIFASEVCIWKDPVTDMQRTKAIGLLHKQVVKDSCMSRQGIPDYVCTFRKPGENPNPVAGELDYWCGDDSFKHEGRLSIDIWQRYASPIWTDIRPGNTLQHTTARDGKDERHICPLQLDVIERCIQLWTNEGDMVLSPFAGIGSEGFVAVKMGRKFTGIELKKSYWNHACKNLKRAEDISKEGRLF